MEARQAELLPVPYFHVVFTIPAPIAAVAFHNKRVVYDILFRASAEALRTIAADPRHLGAEIGAIAVLHTWGQTLHLHPHVHCIVRRRIVAGPDTLGSLSPPLLLASPRPLELVPRRCSCNSSRRLPGGELPSPPLLPTSDHAAFAARLVAVAGIEWDVYAKPPFAGPKQVLEYLGRYTHRVAIANTRLIGFADDPVIFTWKDYRQDRKTNDDLDADEFIRRFLQHAVPDGFHRIRHIGLLANRPAPRNSPLPQTPRRTAAGTGRSIPAALAGSPARTDGPGH